MKLRALVPALLVIPFALGSVACDKKTTTKPDDKEKADKEGEDDKEEDKEEKEEAGGW
jgi:ribosomal protein L12E/L44/L45/RPP1/RPP2